VSTNEPLPPSLPSPFLQDKYEGSILLPKQIPTGLEVTLQAESVSQSAVYLKWTRPIQPFTILEIVYAIEVSVDGFALGAQNNTFDIRPIPDPAKGEFAYYNVTGLSQHIMYEFRVRAKTPYSPDFLHADIVVSNSVLPPPPHPSPAPFPFHYPRPTQRILGGPEPERKP